MFSGRLTAPNDTVMLIQKSRDVTPYFITEDSTTHELSYSKICATSCELRCLSHAVMFCCTCNFYGFRHRLFWIILQLLLSLHLLSISNCLGSVAETYWRQSASASDLLWHLFLIVPISILLIPPPNALLIRWSHIILISESIFHTMDLNFAYYIMVCAFCCKAAIVLIEQNIQSELLSLNYSFDACELVSVNTFALVAALQIPAL